MPPRVLYPLYMLSLGILSQGFNYCLYVNYYQIYLPIISCF